MGYVYINPTPGRATPKPPRRVEKVIELPNDKARRAYAIAQDPELARPENLDKLRRTVAALPPVLIVGENVAGDSVTQGDL